jgi:hypothetical protein
VPCDADVRAANPAIHKGRRGVMSMVATRARQPTVPVASARQGKTTLAARAARKQRRSTTASLGS